VKIHQATGYSKGELYLNGISAGERLIIIDDVVSTGGTLEAVWQAVGVAGGIIVDTVVVIERGDGAKQLRQAGLPVKTLVKVDVGPEGVEILG